MDSLFSGIFAKIGDLGWKCTSDRDCSTSKGTQCAFRCPKDVDCSNINLGSAQQYCLKKYNTSCTKDDDCIPNHACDKGKCKIDFQQLCTKTDECVSGYLCEMGPSNNPKTKTCKLPPGAVCKDSGECTTKFCGCHFVYDKLNKVWNRAKDDDCKPPKSICMYKEQEPCQRDAQCETNVCHEGQCKLPDRGPCAGRPNNEWCGRERVPANTIDGCGTCYKCKACKNGVCKSMRCYNPTPEPVSEVSNEPPFDLAGFLDSTAAKRKERQDKLDEELGDMEFKIPLRAVKDPDLAPPKDPAPPPAGMSKKVKIIIIVVVVVLVIIMFGGAGGGATVVVRRRRRAAASATANTPKATARPAVTQRTVTTPRAPPQMMRSSPGMMMPMGPPMPFGVQTQRF